MSVARDVRQDPTDAAQRVSGAVVFRSLPDSQQAVSQVQGLGLVGRWHVVPVYAVGGCWMARLRPTTHQGVADLVLRHAGNTAR